MLVLTVWHALWTASRSQSRLSWSARQRLRCLRRSHSVIHLTVRLRFRSCCYYFIWVSRKTFFCPHQFYGCRSSLGADRLKFVSSTLSMITMNSIDYSGWFSPAHDRSQTDRRSLCLSSSPLCFPCWAVWMRVWLRSWHVAESHFYPLNLDVQVSGLSHPARRDYAAAVQLFHTVSYFSAHLPSWRAPCCYWTFWRPYFFSGVLTCLCYFSKRK